MQRKVLLVAAALVIAVITADAQERTVGLMLNDPRSFNGYILFTVGSYATTYLINNEGLLVHSWKDTIALGGAYLESDGYLYRTFTRKEDRPGLTGVKKVDWDDNVLWTYIYKGVNYGAQHDFAVLPNGNVILQARQIKDSLECAQAGANLDLLLDGTIFADYLVEVQPVGDTGGNIVWEWHVWDHLVQDFDVTKDNYGVPGDHPELVDPNAGLPKFEWPHFNSLDYNLKFDQIIFTSMVTSELYVIDHSTTTEEARGHTGGNSGKGGDFLYRWGNPQTYDQGTQEDEKLFITHGGNVVPEGYPGAGHFLMLNNGSGRGYSSIEEIVPPVDEEGNYIFTPPRWGPDEAIWTWTEPNPEDFYSPMKGGKPLRLPNGNTLITDPFDGEFFQVTPEKEIAWYYINPVSENGPVHQGDPNPKSSAQPNFYTSDYPGLAGKDLTPKGPIELPGVEENEPVNRVELELSSNLVKSNVAISYQLSMPGHVSIKLYNALGQSVRTLVNETKSSGSYTLTWDGTDGLGHRLSSGVYFIKLETGNTSLKERIVLIK